VKAQCTARVPFETLVAWYANDLGEAEADALEEHVMSCDECAAFSLELGKLIGGLREVIPPVISEAMREGLAARGKRILITPCAPGESPTARFAPDIDVMVHSLQADLSRAERIDVEVLDGQGNVKFLLEDVPFGAGEVLVACQRHYRALHAEGEHPTFRVHATEAGERRRVGDYLVIHVWE
jgi:hypothetical protein